MNTRRIPFQFSSTDPVARQRELEKRFGLQPTCSKMYVDVNNPLSMGAGTPKETSSPRLQHRVPIFVEGYDQPIHSSSVDSMASVPDNKKANVRIIPIEVEGTDRSSRHRTYSGPADALADRCEDNLASERSERFPFKKYNFENSPKPKVIAEPRVYNIPIQVEGANNVTIKSQPKMVPKPKVDATTKPQISTPAAKKECPQPKLPSKVESSNNHNEMQPEPNENKVDQSKTYVEIALKKVEDVLTEFKTYETGVYEFTGTSKDKQYRYLDEMLTRCMLRLDDIDTMGNEEIRLARKNAVKKVQASIDLLDSKTNVQSETVSDIAQAQSTQNENVVEKNDAEMQVNEVMQDNAVTSTENDICTEIKEMCVAPNGDKDQSKDSVTIINSNVETGNTVESTKVTLETTNNVTDIEMNEIPQEKADSMMQDEESVTPSLQQQQNSMPEVEMTEEISLDKINSTNDAQSSELLGSDSATQNDVDMLDESTSIKVGESPLKETAENINDISIPSEISDVEMAEVHSPEKSEKTECEIVEKSVDLNSESSAQKTENELVSNDTVSPKNSPDILDGVNHESGDKCKPNLPEQESKCAIGQSEKDLDVK